jgi:hypothetical protein
LAVSFRASPMAAAPRRLFPVGLHIPGSVLPPVPVIPPVEPSAFVPLLQAPLPTAKQMTNPPYGPPEPRSLPLVFVPETLRPEQQNQIQDQKQFVVPPGFVLAPIPWPFSFPAFTTPAVHSQNAPNTAVIA